MERRRLSKNRPPSEEPKPPVSTETVADQPDPAKKAPKKKAAKKTAKKSSRKKSSAPTEVSDVYGQVEEVTETFSSGCTVFDLALGGGLAQRRIINIVGDNSTGKTLAVMEACANFRLKYPGAVMRYAECESAFDKTYARNLGIPVDAIRLTRKIRTVEGWYDDLRELLEEHRGTDTPLLYILDSLDALSDEAEADREIRKGSFQMTKQKLIGELFRRLTGEMADANLTLIMISQVRANVGVMIGKKQRRSGGKALDFYCSQIIWLTKIKNITRTVRKVERVTGVTIRAKVEKNKVGPAFREAMLPIQFNYGVDDLRAGLVFLRDVSRTDEVGLNDAQAARLVSSIPKLSDEDYRERLVDVNDACREVWAEIESDFAPTRKKY